MKSVLVLNDNGLSFTRMNIVKAIENVCKSDRYIGLQIDFGLGENGKLYYCARSPGVYLDDGHEIWTNFVKDGFGIDIGDMKKIVAALGHLGAWI